MVSWANGFGFREAFFETVKYSLWWRQAIPSVISMRDIVFTMVDNRRVYDRANVGASEITEFFLDTYLLLNDLIQVKMTTRSRSLRKEMKLIQPVLNLSRLASSRAFQQ